MKKKLEVTLVNEKEMIVSGKLNDYMISHMKGIYFKPKDNQFGELGKNTQPYCFTGTLILDYPAHVQAEMDKLIPIITDSFKGNFSSLFTEY